MSIGFKSCGSWNESREKVERILKSKGYFSQSPSILVNFSKDRFTDNKTLIINQNVTIQCDKIRMNKALDNLGIPHPKTYYYPFLYYYPNICTLPDSNEECVVKSKQGERGCSIQFSTFKKLNVSRLTGWNFVQHFVPFEREFRVLVDFLGVIGIKEKIGTSKLKNSRTCKLEKVYNEKIGMFAIDACRKMRVDFSGLDIGEINGKYFVIELNSAPALSREHAKIFANHLIGILYR